MAIIYLERSPWVTAVIHEIRVYNQIRPHSAIAMKTPLEYEEDLVKSKSVKPSS